ncbi:hypothetical protein PG984_010283 [Apiospora sp. TS-2023a]
MIGAPNIYFGSKGLKQATRSADAAERSANAAERSAATARATLEYSKRKDHAQAEDDDDSGHRSSSDEGTPPITAAACRTTKVPNRLRRIFKRSKALDSGDPVQSDDSLKARHSRSSKAKTGTTKLRLSGVIFPKAPTTSPSSLSALKNLHAPQHDPAVPTNSPDTSRSDDSIYSEPSGSASRQSRNNKAATSNPETPTIGAPSAHRRADYLESGQRRDTGNTSTMAQTTPPSLTSGDETTVDEHSDAVKLQTLAPLDNSSVFYQSGEPQRQIVEDATTFNDQTTVQPAKFLNDHDSHIHNPQNAHVDENKQRVGGTDFGPEEHPLGTHKQGQQTSEAVKLHGFTIPMEVSAALDKGDEAIVGPGERAECEQSGDSPVPVEPAVAVHETTYRECQEPLETSARISFDGDGRGKTAIGLRGNARPMPGESNKPFAGSDTETQKEHCLPDLTTIDTGSRTGPEAEFKDEEGFQTGSRGKTLG